ncbi:MAG: outer membrane protein assembly factor [Sumerlaeia bacterium]
MPALLRNIRTLLIGFALLAAAVPLAARQLPLEGEPIADVEIRGLDRYPEANVLQVMELDAGDAFSGAALRRDLDAIVGLGVFDPLSLRAESEANAQGETVLVIVVRENPVVNSIGFIGNVKYSSDRLRRELDFKEGDILPAAVRTTAARNIRRFYEGGGYKGAEVSVRVREAEGEASGADVTITIDEGRKIQIKDLIIRGNSAIPDWRLKPALTNSGSWLIFKNYYDENAFEDDLRMVERKYADKGYLDAKATADDPIYDEDEAKISPVIVVEEGPRYRVRDVEIAGNALFGDEEVRKPFAPMIGDVFDGEETREAFAKLRRLYGDQGYIDAKVDGTFVRHPEDGSVTIDVEIVEGAQVFVGDIRVQKPDYSDVPPPTNPIARFLESTSPGVTNEAIMREVQLEPGDVWRDKEERRSVQRLRRLGFFRDVRVRRVPTEDPRINDAVVEVEEDATAGYFGVSAGVGERSGPAITLSYDNPNLLGDARDLSIYGTVGRRSSGFGISYLDRYLGDSENSLRLRAYRDAARFDGIGERIYGTSGELGVPMEQFGPFDEYWTSFIRLRLEQVNLIRRDQDLESPVDGYHVAALRTMLRRDIRNDLRWPTEGYTVAGGFETGYADGFLLKALHDFEWYKALDDEEDWVYAYEHTVGLMPYDIDDIGYTERFFLGGTSTLRGFEARGIGPTDRGDDSTHIGGATSVAQSHELRRRFNRYFAGRVFVDAGVLENDPLEWGTPRVGTGVGVTFNAGPAVVDFDLAAPVVREDDDEPQVFHFRLRGGF